MNEKILKVRNVAKAFDGREMIHGMNLSVERGMIYGLLGVNGAGKTTTFKMITGLLRPDSGEIIFSGTSVSGQDKEFLREMGILIETPVFYEHLSARENLELHLQYMGCGVDKIEEVLNRAGLQNTGRQPRAVDKPPNFVNVTRYHDKNPAKIAEIFQRKRSWFPMPWPLSSF